MRGLLSGLGAGALAYLISLIAGALNITELRFVDYTSYLVFGSLPDTTLDFIVASFVTILFSCILGTIFVILLQYTTKSHLYIKGWFYGMTAWWLWYSLLTMTFAKEMQEISGMTSISNMTSSSVYGITLVYLSQRLKLS